MTYITVMHKTIALLVYSSNCNQDDVQVRFQKVMIMIIINDVGLSIKTTSKGNSDLFVVVDMGGTLPDL